MKDSNSKPPIIDTPDELRKLRSDLGFSVAQMAAALQISPSTIEAWESGNRTITMEFAGIRKLAGEYAGGRTSAGNFLYGIIPLKAARHMVDMNIEQFANLVGVNVRIMRAYEQGVRKLPERYRIALERQLADRYRQLQKLSR